MQEGTAGGEPDGRDLSSSFAIALFRYLERAGGPTLVEEVLARAEYVEPVEDLLGALWVSRSVMLRLAEAAAAATGDAQIGRRTGEELFRICAEDSKIRGYLLAAGTPAAALERLLAYTGNLGQGRIYHLVSLTDEEMAVDAEFVPAHCADPFFCELVLGFWPHVPSLFGAAGVGVQPTCQTRGDRVCRFLIRWKSSDVTDNPEIVAQRELLGNRIQNFEDMQLIAADLARVTDLEALAERVLDAIEAIAPAPRILAAIRGGGADKLVVASRGLATAAARVVAGELLDGTYDGRLGLPVAAPMGPHGVIAAIIPREQPVSERESRLLTAFARHATARVETLLADRAAEESRQTASALLHLARALSETATEQEVCDCIVRAIPGLLRADHSSVLRWNSEDHSLRPVAVVGPGGRAPYSELTVKDAPNLIDLAAHPVPFLLHPASAPPAVAAAMNEWGDAVDVIVPLAEQGEFLGLLCAGYREALTLDQETAFERLQGVADLAIPALSKTRLLDEVRHQALHDSLTGLPNRTFLEQEVKGRLADPDGGSLALLFIDLDRFKNVNDSLGHDYGDVLIRQAADRIQDALRPSDTLARMGGDEFVVALPDVPSPAAAEAVAGRIIQHLEQPFHLAGRYLYVSASIGIAVRPVGGGDYASLLQEADGAMYAAKAGGRGRMASRPVTPSGANISRLTLETELHGALESGQISVLFQPQVSLTDLTVTGAEALVRWEHPRLGQLPPSEFLPVAEACALLAQLDRHVRRIALGQAASWTATLGPLTLALNLSGQSLARPELVAEILADLEHAGLDPSAVEIEVTEEAVGDDLIPVVTELAAAGLRIAVDDFGTGASVFARLQCLPLHTLKIDRSLVQGTHPSRVEAILGAITSMSHDLGLSVVAEGVENPVQAGQLRRAGCDHAQGDLFGRPMPAAELERVLVSQRCQVTSSAPIGPPLVQPGR